MLRFKVTRPFITDPIPQLQLAVFLRLKVWPSQYGVGPTDIRITPEETAHDLRERYGRYGRTSRHAPSGRNAEWYPRCTYSASIRPKIYCSSYQ